MNYKRRLVFRWVLVFGWLVLTVYLSQQPSAESSATSGWLARILFKVVRHFRPSASYAIFHHLVRKAAHFIAHFVLAWLGYRAFMLCFNKQLYAVVSALSIFGLIAVYDELIQSVAPGRAMMIGDAMINIAGIFSGVLFGIFATMVYDALKQ
ncbi:VanZ family protein [Candidatus Saccharibacteria bacterium]|nr:VanZ family protein [Candidatus Saccharibacteria bacterium]